MANIRVTMGVKRGWLRSLSVKEGVVLVAFPRDGFPRVGFGLRPAFEGDLGEEEDSELGLKCAMSD